MADDDDEVGYGKPPRQHRFQKGRSGNPAGRPKKKNLAQDVRSMLERISNEEIEVAGRKMTRHELELRSLQHKAAKGDVTASRLLMNLRERAGCDKPVAGGGMLVVPGTASLETWSIAAAIQQAKFREGETDND